MRATRAAVLCVGFLHHQMSVIEGITDMVRLTQRSAVNHPEVMRLYRYADAKIDHPHLPAREVRRLSRPEDRRRPLRTSLGK